VRSENEKYSRIRFRDKNWREKSWEDELAMALSHVPIGSKWSFTSTFVTFELYFPNFVIVKATADSVTIGIFITFFKSIKNYLDEGKK
jgi:hypothetical protein